MAIGPVQLIAPGFSHLEFHGEIIAELEPAPGALRALGQARWLRVRH